MSKPCIRRWLDTFRGSPAPAPTPAREPAPAAPAAPDRPASIDSHPWEHPYLTAANIARFRSYSEDVWRVAREHAAAHPRRLRCAFSVNLAQNMYKWGTLAQKYGAEAELFLHPMDAAAVSAPEWEEFDGEHADVHDGKGFLNTHPDIAIAIPARRIALVDSGLLSAAIAFDTGDRKPLLRLLDGSGVRYEPLIQHEGFYPYFDWARSLSEFDVIYTASAPFAAYASGRPYCVFSVGGDLQMDCGRSDSFGEAMTLAFNAARFVLVSNPHTLGHSRRLGFTNGVYLPYPMDSDRYCPGEGRSRLEWESRYGPGVYVLTTARLDSSVKGFGDELYRMLAAAVADRPQLRFIFLAWGTNAQEFRDRIAADGLQDRMIVLPPVGKKRLIDYYRSCDVVLDTFVYGYYGATALEAAAIGKPVVMMLRREHYAPLYAGDVAPVIDARTPEEIRGALLALTDDADLRRATGLALREWLVRNHGEQRTVPLMLALLQLAADRVPPPPGLASPLLDAESEPEGDYHRACLAQAQ